MALTVPVGGLRHIWGARCHGCKRLLALESAVTSHGARSALQNLGWAEHSQRGWLCRECREVTPKRY